MVIMRVWTLAHTHTHFPTAFIVLLCTLLQKILLSRCRAFIFPGLRGYFPPRKKQSTLNSTMFFLPHVLPPFFSGFCFTKKTNASIANVSQRFVGIGPANFTSQVVPTTRCLTKKCTDGNHFSWRWTSPFWGVFGCLGYWSIFSTCEEYVWSTWYI